MQDASALVNTHYLRHLVSLSAEEEVKATEDVFSASGVKLIGKGTRISEGMYERIVSHKLIRPLESSISIGDPVTPQALKLTAESLLDSSPSLARLIGQSSNLDSALGVVKSAQFGEQAGALLKLHEARLPASLNHGVLVGLVAMSLMKRMRPTDRGALDRLIVASFFHDIGELYIDPALHRNRSNPFNAEEWQQMAAHPAIGHAVLKNMSGIAPIIAELVLEHHERLDGGGYPHGRRKGEISEEGHILAVAETLSRFIGDSSEPFAYAEVALKIIPGEFSHSVIDAVAACREELRAARVLQEEIDAVEGLDPSSTDFQVGMSGLFTKIGQTCDVMAQLESQSKEASAGLKHLLSESQQYLQRVTRAISSTGLDQALNGVTLGEASEADLLQIRLEFDVTVSEVHWRLVELSRRLMQQQTKLAPEEVALLSPLVNVLAKRV
ncbi:MAG: HD domain-containing protein [Rhodocyclaceae bacterium]|nr:HD domain-containing protein [Rhodocyclaceae bacterium]